MNIKGKPIMAVIRGIRPSEATFYDDFKRIKIKFIYFSRKPITYPVNVKNLDLINLLIKPKYLVDPIALLNHGVYTNRSWVEIEGLEEQLKDVDVINITDTFYSWSAQAAKIAKKLNKKLVTIVWETIFRHPAVYIPPYSSSVREVIGNTDLFILRSKTALRFIETFDIPRKKIKVIYKGIDTNRFRPSRTNSKPADTVRILYIGQLTKSKGIDDLLKAFCLLYKEFSNIELVLAGEGPLIKVVKQVAEEYPIKHLGFVDYFRLPEVYSKADIFCSPSKDIKYFGIKIWEELFSYTLIEAQASGLPIVATNCGAIPEEVGRDNFLVNQGDVNALYRTLGKLVKDDRLRIELGRKNRKRAEKFFDLEKQARKTEEAILSILN